MLNTFSSATPSQLLTANLNEWLCFPGSMTARMEAYCSDLKIKCLAQSTSKPLATEQALLTMSDVSDALVREIIMLADGKPWLYGRTVIPTASLTGSWSVYKNLNTTPLGKLLFSNAAIKRSEFEYAQLSDINVYYQLVKTHLHDLNANDLLWARRSFFNEGQQHKLLLTEVFLPPLCDFIENL